ncbi:MAG TPA: PAS domain S-box protein [Thermoguttaceae bacterium]|nr:PAS domain S-box protein [Thermoguttaceae bacterium]
MSQPLPQDATDTSAAAAAGDRRDPRSRQQAVVAIGRRAIALPDLSILMQDAASLIAEALGVEFSGVAELTPDGSKIIHKLTLEGPDGANTRPFVGESAPDGTDSLAGYALEIAFPVAIAELSQDTRFCDPFLQRHGIRSAIAIPLKLPGQSFGALLACSREVRQFDTEDVLFVETVAHLVTNNAARVRMEEDFAAERRLAAEVLQTVGAIVLVLDPQGRIVRANRACEHLTGFASDEIEDRPIWDVLPVPDEADSFRTVFNRLNKGVSTMEHESQLLTKHGERRQICWSYSVVRGADQSIESVVATGIDVTAERQAEEKAAKAEQMAAAARSASASKQEEDGTPSAGGGPATPQDQPLGEAAALPGPINSERRRRARLSYPYHQRIAPIVDGRLPADDEFTEIQCNDIAAGGFSFISPKPPQSGMLVVALGTPPKFSYLTAQVAHVTRIEREGRRMYLVGCSYIGRVAY